MAQDDRPFIRVHEGMPDHPKVESLSDRAFRLLVETWCWCARQRTDGRVPLGTWNKRGTPKARRELLAAGLIEQYDDRAEVHDYLSWQRSAAEIAEAIEQKRTAGGLGGHVRWHVAADKYEPDCPHCQREQSQPPSHPPSRKRWRPLSRVQSRIDSDPMAETETETEEERGVTYVGDVTSADARDETPPSKSPPRTDTRPDERCARHRDVVGEVPPCGACADARKSAVAFDAQRRDEIRTCRMCDPDGFRYEPGRRVPLQPWQRCDHVTPTETEARHA